MQVVDAGVVVAALVQGDDLGARARAAVADSSACPELLDLEVGAVLRRLTLAGRLTRRRGHEALQDLVDLPLERASHRPLLARCWELRDALSFYDAAYVALAELLDLALVTTDTRLARSVGRRCEVRVLD